MDFCEESALSAYETPDDYLKTEQVEEIEPKRKFSLKNLFS